MKVLIAVLLILLLWQGVEYANLESPTPPDTSELRQIQESNKDQKEKRLEEERKQKVFDAKVRRVKKFCKPYPKALCHQMPEMYVRVADKVGHDFRIFVLINVQEQSQGVSPRHNAYGYSYPTKCNYRYCTWTKDRAEELEWIMGEVKRKGIWGTGRTIDCRWSPAGKSSFACRNFDKI